MEINNRHIGMVTTHRTPKLLYKDFYLTGRQTHGARELCDETRKTKLAIFSIMDIDLEIKINKILFDDGCLVYRVKDKNAFKLFLIQTAVNDV